MTRKVFQADPWGRTRLWPDSLKEDLSVLLSGEKTLYFSVSPSGAILTLKSREVLSFGEVCQGSRWISLGHPDRIRTFAGWLHRASVAASQVPPAPRWVKPIL